MSAIIHQIHQRRVDTRISPTAETAAAASIASMRMSHRSAGRRDSAVGEKVRFDPARVPVFAAGQMARVSASAVKPFFRFIHSRVPFSEIPHGVSRGAWLKGRGIRRCRRVLLRIRQKISSRG